MSRSGYSEDCEGVGLWRGAVASAIRGARGQALLRELVIALDAMPVKALAENELVTADGQFCTLGVLGAARGLDLNSIDAYDPQSVGWLFNIAPALAAEIVYENDEVVDSGQWIEVEISGPMRGWNQNHIKSVRFDHSPEAIATKRYQHMRKWVADQLIEGSKA